MPRQRLNISLTPEEILEAILDLLDQAQLDRARDEHGKGVIRLLSRAVESGKDILALRPQEAEEEELELGISDLLALRAREE